MGSHFEVRGPSGVRLAALETDRICIGRGEQNDVVLAEQTVSDFHAVLERHIAGWVLRDVGSTNGTFVNGERLAGERRLRPNDEVRIGESHLILRAEGTKAPSTMAAQGPPALTRRERDVLIALCRPMAGADIFTPPASIKEMADELFVTEAAIKAHLVNLYDKFDLHEQGSSRRVRLAQEAVRRHAITLADLTRQGRDT